MSAGRTLRLILVMAPLAVWAWLGITEGLNGWQDAASAGQRICAASQILSGVAAIPCLIALFSQPAWLRLAFLVWAALLTMTGGTAPVVWGGTPVWQGIVAGGITALVAALVCWGAFAGERAWRKNQPRS
jgi:hypothetical protein